MQCRQVSVFSSIKERVGPGSLRSFLALKFFVYPQNIASHYLFQSKYKNINVPIYGFGATRIFCLQFSTTRKQAKKPQAESQFRFQYQVHFHVSETWFTVLTSVVSISNLKTCRLWSAINRCSLTLFLTLASFLKPMYSLHFNFLFSNLKIDPVTACQVLRGLLNKI